MLRHVVIQQTKRKYAFVYESEYRHCAYSFCLVVFFSDRRFNYATDEPVQVIEAFDAP